MTSGHLGNYTSLTDVTRSRRLVFARCRASFSRTFAVSKTTSIPLS